MPEKILGREVKETYTFKEKGTFQSMYAAQGWCSKNGYSYGSTSNNRLTGAKEPVALRKGEYDLPQKWYNFSAIHKLWADGVMMSNDWREGEVKIYIF